MGAEFLVGDDEKILEQYSGDGYISQWLYLMPMTVHLKIVKW